MENPNKITIDQIIYLISDESGVTHAARNKIFRRCMMAVEDLVSYAALETYEEKKAIREGSVELFNDYMYIRQIEVESTPCYTTDQAFQLYGNTSSSSSSYYVYSIRNGKIEFEKPYNGIDGRLCNISYRVLERNEQGDVVVPRTMQEAIIAYVNASRAKDIYFESKGARGRGLYQDMQAMYERKKREFYLDIEQSGESEMQYLSMIWNSKVPLSATKYYNSGKKNI